MKLQPDITYCISNDEIQEVIKMLQITTTISIGHMIYNSV